MQEHCKLVQELEHYSLFLERWNLVLPGNCSLLLVQEHCSLEQVHHMLVQVLMKVHCSLVLMNCHVEEGHLQEGRRFACRPIQVLEEVGIFLALVASR